MCWQSAFAAVGCTSIVPGCTHWRSFCGHKLFVCESHMHACRRARVLAFPATQPCCHTTHRSCVSSEGSACIWDCACVLHCGMSRCHPAELAQLALFAEHRRAACTPGRCLAYFCRNCCAIGSGSLLLSEPLGGIGQLFIHDIHFRGVEACVVNLVCGCPALLAVTAVTCVL
jgi:hypothetical protein